jgi:Papain family cysteine protease
MSLGWAPGVDDDRPPLQSFLDEETSPPLSRMEKFLRFSWASPVDWSRFGAPIRHQGTHQTCTSHAVAAMVEAVKRSEGDLITTLSPTFIHTCLGGVEPGQGLGPLRLQRAVGLGKSVPPYVGPDPWPPSQCMIADGTLLTRLREVRGDIDAKAALARAPVVASLKMGLEFNGLRGRYYRPTGSTSGDHIVCIVAQTSDGWLIQNSYGPTWGDGGYAELAIGTGGLLRPGLPAVTLA